MNNEEMLPADESGSPENTAHHLRNPTKSDEIRFSQGRVRITQRDTPTPVIQKSIVGSF